MTRSENYSKEKIQEQIDTMVDNYLADLSTEEKKEVLMTMAKKMNVEVTMWEMMRNSMPGCCK